MELQLDWDEKRPERRLHSAVGMRKHQAVQLFLWFPHLSMDERTEAFETDIVDFFIP